MTSLAAEHGLWGLWASVAAAPGFGSCCTWPLEHRLQICGVPSQSVYRLSRRCTVSVGVPSQSVYRLSRCTVSVVGVPSQSVYRLSRLCTVSVGVPSQSTVYRLSRPAAGGILLDQGGSTL